MKKTVAALTMALGIGMIGAMSVQAETVTMPDGTQFDPEYYAQSNPDVVAVFGTSAEALYTHYCLSGKAEGRLPVAPTETEGFDAAYYAAKYPDLVAAFGNDPVMLAWHYANFGIKEGRYPNAQAEAGGTTVQAEQVTQQTTQNSAYDTVPVGSYITFGHYEQDNNLTNGAEPIEWLVLAHENGRTLVISRYILDRQKFTENYSDNVTWDNSYLRSWMNGSFYQTAFTPAEQAQIASVRNENPATFDYFQLDYTIQYYTNRGHWENHLRSYGSTGGNATQDKVFCLSWEEALKYFDSDEARICEGTIYEYTRYHGSSAYATNEKREWRLRSAILPEVWKTGYEAMTVIKDGHVDFYINGGTSPKDEAGIRPAIWLY